MTGTPTSSTPSSPTPAELADQGAEAIRALNHATLHREGYVWPADVDAVIGALEAMALRLPQAFAQAVTWLATAHALGRVGHDQHPGEHPHSEAVTDEVNGLLGDLEHAARDARELALTLGSARMTSTHLTGTREDDPR